MALPVLLLLATLCPLGLGQVTAEEPLLWNILAGLADQVLGPRETSTRPPVDLSATISTLLTEYLPSLELQQDEPSPDRIDQGRPTRPTRPPRRPLLPQIPDFFKQAEVTTTTTTTTTTTAAPSTDLCPLVCSVGRPAVSVAGLTACVGSLVAVAVDEEESSGSGDGSGNGSDSEEGFVDNIIVTIMPYVQPELICPITMVTYAVASGALDPAVCQILCAEMTAAARRVDATGISEQLFDLTGLYINPEASLLTPAIVTARVVAGLVLSAVESQDRLDGPGNRTLTGDACDTVCEFGQPVVLAAALVSCGASLLVNEFTDDSFIEDTVVHDVTKPTLVCPLALMVWGVYEALVDPAICSAGCKAMRARTPPMEDVLPSLAIMASVAKLIHDG